MKRRQRPGPFAPLTKLNIHTNKDTFEILNKTNNQVKQMLDQISSSVKK